jgi:hypothetical protein
MADTLAQRQTEFGNYIIKGFPKLGLPGWPMASACAGVGNGTQENLCRPVTPGTKDHGSDGIMQWRLTRLTDMQSWCIKNFNRWDTLQAQAAFFMYEVKRDYPILYADLIAGAKTIPTLTANICAQYERPAAASAMLNQRIKYAEDAHALLTAKPSPSGKVAASAAVVATATGAGAAHAAGMPWWGTCAILAAGVAGIIAFAIIEAKKPKPTSEPTK